MGQFEMPMYISVDRDCILAVNRFLIATVGLQSYLTSCNEVAKAMVNKELIKTWDDIYIQGK